LPSPAPTRLRVAAIDFLNPAPLMWDFEHPPLSSALAQRYDVHYTQPSLCADELLFGRADLGLIPIASLTTGLAIVPGCAIASLDRVRSIQLIVKLDRLPSHLVPARPRLTAAERRSLLAAPPQQIDDPSLVNQALAGVRTVAADAASRSSVAYAQVLFRKFLSTDPEFVPSIADPVAMLTEADAALLIGDPALLALEDRAHIEANPAIGPCLWLDLAHEWHTRTGTPWVAAVWAVRPDLLAESEVSPAQLIEDLQHSRDAGLANIEALVDEWIPRIDLPAATIRDYFTRNIHYNLSQDCLDAIQLFRAFAAEARVLPPLPRLRML
jgi:chorismate dehydratase